MVLFCCKFSKLTVLWYYLWWVYRAKLKTILNENLFCFFINFSNATMIFIELIMRSIAALSLLKHFPKQHYKTLFHWSFQLYLYNAYQMFPQTRLCHLYLACCIVRDNFCFWKEFEKLPKSFICGNAVVRSVTFLFFARRNTYFFEFYKDARSPTLGFSKNYFLICF